MSICSQTVVFYKILGVGGRGAPPIILLVHKANYSSRFIKNKTKCISLNLCEMIDKDFQGPHTLVHLD